MAAVGLPAAGSALAAPAPIDAQRERIREIEAVIVGLDGRAAQARGAEEDAAAEARRLAAEVRQATAELRTAERDRARARRVLAERIVDIYRRGTPDSVLEVLVSAGSISEAASQRVLLDRVAESDGDVLVRVGRLRDRVARVRAALTARRREAARAAVRAAGLRREAEALAERRRAALDEAQGVLARLEAAERRRQAAEAARRAAARRAAAAARAAARRAATPPPPPPPS
ncbi:MAG: hypothetical protein MUE51_14935, partial [Thermoleophilia bacterium]|nr:hypothetical protein [Thermoleophilia bacterium]